MRKGVTMQRREALEAGLAALFAGASPRAVAQAATVEDETWQDQQRQRDLPMRLRWPADDAPLPPGGRPVLLFSHGLGGTRQGGEVWGEAWAAAGFVVLHLQHPGSDLPAVQREAGGFANLARLRDAVSPRQLLQRLADVVFVLDEVGRRQAAGPGRWSTVRPDGVGMSGHSFGAHTALGMAGQSYPGYPGLAEPRLAAFLALSPAAPAAAAKAAFAAITRPTLCITGSRDGDVLGNGATPQRRLAAYAALPAGQKALLLLQDADHMSFAGQTGLATEFRQREALSRALQPRHHALVAAITADWWRSSLLADASAHERLGQPVGLGEGDQWQRG